MWAVFFHQGSAYRIDDKTGKTFVLDDHGEWAPVKVKETTNSKAPRRAR